MTNSNPTVLIATQYVSSSQTTYYTSPASTTTIIDELIVSNFSGGGVTLVLNIVPNAGSAGSSNKFYSATVANNGVVIVCGYANNAVWPPIFLGPGDFISAIAGSGSSIAIHAGGRQIT